MPRRPIRTWSLLAVLVALVALGAGGRTGGPSPRLLVGTVPGIASQTSPGGVLDAVLRTEADRVESAVSTTSSSTARLLEVLAVALTGIALLAHVAHRRRSVFLLLGAPLPARLRAWVGLRAPPSLLLDPLTP